MNAMLEMQSFSTECSEPGFMQSTCSSRHHVKKEEPHEWQSNLRSASPCQTARSTSVRKPRETGDEEQKKPKIQFQVSGLYKQGQITTIPCIEKIYDLPDEVDLFTDKQVKRMGIPNLLDSEHYNEQRSFRFNLQKINNKQNLKFLEDIEVEISGVNECSLKIKN